MDPTLVTTVFEGEGYCDMSLTGDCRALLPTSSPVVASMRKKPEQEPDRWDTWVVPVMRPDPPGLKTLPMYDRASVYRGTTEFQFEELKMAIFHYRRTRLVPGDERAQTAESSDVHKVEDEAQQLCGRVRELRSLLAATRPSSQDDVARNNRIGFLENSILVTRRSRLPAGLPTEKGPDSDDETGAGAVECAGNPVAAPFQVFMELTVTGAVFREPRSPMGPPMEEGDENSKEGKSSASSSSSVSSGASSAHSVGATLCRGVSGMLPTVQEEEHPQQPPSAVQQGKEGYQEHEYQEQEFQEGCREQHEEEVAGDEEEVEEEMVEEAEREEQKRGGFSVDPFSDAVRSRILRSWQVSESDRGRFHQLKSNHPALKADAHITLGGQQLRVVRHLAAGSYARVYLAETVNTEETFLDDAPDESFQAPVQTQVVLKLDAKSNSGLWEFYVTTELARRLREAYSNQNAVNSVADLLFGCFFSNSSILVFPFSCYGTLLDLVSRYRSLGKGSAVPECLVLYLALELITAVDQVHTCGVIHADIKPDNVLLQDLPSEAGFLDRFGENGVECIKLNDFGRAIDMTALPTGTSFTQVIETDSFKCTEMLSGRPWTFQVDWFGVLGCLHVLLFGEYMAVQLLADGRWAPRLRFKRYWQQDLWTRLFSELLNIPSCAEQPDVTPFLLEIKNLLLKRSRAHDVVMEALRAKNL
ncbi:uncharacterized protein LOC144156844 [Haemaphysalis longicornis]